MPVCVDAMSFLLALFVSGLALVASVQAQTLVPRAYRHSELAQRDLSEIGYTLQKRDANRTFDLSWQIQNRPLFSGSWTLPPKENFEVSLECVDCRTWGQINAAAAYPDNLGEFIKELVADATDDEPLQIDVFNNVNVSVILDGVGGYFDLAVAAKSDGTFTQNLFTSQSLLGVAGPNFQLGCVFFVDLVFAFEGEVSADSGFQFTVPDGSGITIPLFARNNTYDFVGTEISTLPLVMDATANITAGLRLRVQAGLDFVGVPQVQASALVGAYANVAEFRFGAVATVTDDPQNDACGIEAAAEFNINAGAFVKLDAAFGDFDLVNFNPSAATTFFRAAGTTCIATEGFGFAQTAVPTLGPVTPCIGAPVTETVTTTATYAVVSCLVPIFNCPDNMTQQLVVEHAETVESIRCPTTPTVTGTATLATLTAKPGSGTSGSPAATANETTTVTDLTSQGASLTVLPTSRPGGFTLSLQAIPEGEVTSAVNMPASLTPVNNGTITASFVSITPPPSPTPGGTVNAGDGDKSAADARVRATEGRWFGLLLCLIVGLVLF